MDNEVQRPSDDFLTSLRRQPPEARRVLAWWVAVLTVAAVVGAWGGFHLVVPRTLTAAPKDASDATSRAAASIFPFIAPSPPPKPAVKGGGAAGKAEESVERAAEGTTSAPRVQLVPIKGTTPDWR